MSLTNGFIASQPQKTFPANSNILQAGRQGCRPLQTDSTTKKPTPCEVGFDYILLRLFCLFDVEPELHTVGHILYTVLLIVKLLN